MAVTKGLMACGFCFVCLCAFFFLFSFSSPRGIGEVAWPNGTWLHSGHVTHFFLPLAAVHVVYVFVDSARVRRGLSRPHLRGLAAGQRFASKDGVL